MHNHTRQSFVVYARRDAGTERLGTRLWSLDRGGSRAVGLSSFGGSHLLTFVFDGESDEGARLRVAVDTAVRTNTRGRTIRMMVLSENEVMVVDSAVGRTSVRRTVHRAGTTEVMDTHDSDEDDVQISWTHPSVQEARAICNKHIQVHVSKNLELESQWEADLNSLLKAHERDQNTLSGLLKQAAVQAAPVAADAAQMRKYRLRNKHDTNPVFKSREYSDDVRTVRDGPSANAKQLGSEKREVIQVMEEREVARRDGFVDTWLRCAPRPGDRSQCWLKASGSDAVWELAPQTKTAQASSSFFLASGLKVLQVALAQSVECSDVLLECAAGFAEQLEPMCLFESAGPAIDEALKALLDWLVHCAAESESADRVVLILCKIASARGTLPAIISLCKFFAEHPERITGSALQTIEKLFEPSGFEASAQGLFCEPAPGTLEQQVRWWRTKVIPHVRAAVTDPGDSGSREANDIARKIEEALMTDSFDEAVAHVRSTVTKDSFAVLQLRPLQDFVNTAEARLYKCARGALAQQRHKLTHAEPEADDILAFFILQISLVSLRLRPLESRWEDRMNCTPVCIDHTAVQELVVVLESQHAKLLRSSDEHASKHVVLCTLHLLRLNVEAMNGARMLLDESQARALHSVLAIYLDTDTKMHPHCTEIRKACADVYAISQDSFLRTPEAKSATAQELVSQCMSAPVYATGSAGLHEAGPLEHASSADSFGMQLNVLTPLLISRKVNGIQATPQGYVKAESGSSNVCTPKASQLLLGVSSTTVMSGGQFYLSARVDAKTTLASRDNPQGIQSLMLGLVRPNADVERLSDDSVGQQQSYSTERWFYHPLSGTLDCADGNDQDLVCEEWVHRTTSDFWRTPDAASMFDCMGLLLDLDAGALFSVLNGRILGKVLGGLTGEFCWAVAIGDNLGVTLSAARIHVSDGIDTARSVDQLVAELAADHLATAPVAPTSDETAVVGHLAASILKSLAQRDVLALKNIMQGTSTQSASFVTCALSLWRHCAVQSSDGSCTLDLQFSDADPVDENWGWVKAHRSFQLQNDDHVAARERGTSPDYAGVLGPAMTSGIYEVGGF